MESILWTSCLSFSLSKTYSRSLSIRYTCPETLDHDIIKSKWQKSYEKIVILAFQPAQP